MFNPTTGITTIKGQREEVRHIRWFWPPSGPFIPDSGHLIGPYSKSVFRISEILMIHLNSELS